MRSCVAPRFIKSESCFSSEEVSPFDHLHHDEVATISRVEEDQAVRTGGLELEEQMHGSVGLQSGEGQVAGLGQKGDGVGDDVPQAESSVQLAVGDVSVLALVQIQHPVEGERLQVTDEVGRHHGDETALRHDARLDVVELQAGVGAGHVTCRRRNVTTNAFCTAFVN